MVYFVASGCSLPTGLNLDAFSGEISGTIAAGADTGSPYSVAVTAMDEVTGANATQTFNWTVNAVTVSLTNPGDQTNYDGDAVTLNLSASENASHSLTYSVTSGALPPGLSLDPSTGAITGTISSTADTGSPYSVTVDAADAITGTDDPQSFNWTVSAVTVSLTSPGDQTNNDADAVGFYLSATDSAGHTLVYTVDSTNVLPPGLSLDPASGRIYGVISTSADTDSPYTATVTATDSAANVSDSKTFTWTVNWAVSTSDETVTTSENQAVALTAADFGLMSGDGVTDIEITGLPTGGTLTDNGAAVTVGEFIPRADLNSLYCSYMPALDGFGPGYDNFGFAQARDGTVSDSPPPIMVLNVNFVNQQPSFTANNPPATNESLSVTIPGWATFYAGAPNESSQTATYIITNVSNPSLFSAGPALDASGTLTFTWARCANGTCTFDVQVEDSGGTANNGCDMSSISTFTVSTPLREPERPDMRDAYLFPGGITYGAYNQMNPNQQAQINSQMANSIFSGANDANLAAAVISQLGHQGAFSLLNNMITADGQGGYTVTFWNAQAGGIWASQTVQVAAPTGADFRTYGAAYGRDNSQPALWFTILAKAYVQQYGQNAANGAPATIIGNLFAASAQSWNPGGLAQAVSANRLDDPTAIATATTYATFNANQQATAGMIGGVWPGTTYAVVAFDGNANVVTLMNTYSGASIQVSIANFQSLFDNLTSTTGR